METTVAQEKTQEQLEYSVRIRLARIDAAYEHIKRSNKIRGQYWAGVVFVSDDFVNDIEKNVAELPFSSKVAMMAREILVNRRYKDFLFIGKCDFPDANIWNICEDFMLVIFRAVYRGQSIGALVGIGSRGWDLIELYLIDENNEDYRDCHVNSLKNKNRHSCSAVITTTNIMGMDYGKFNEDYYHLTVEVGQMTTCNKCGYMIFADFMDGEKIWKMCEKYAGFVDELAQKMKKYEKDPKEDDKS